MCYTGAPTLTKKEPNPLAAHSCRAPVWILSENWGPRPFAVRFPFSFPHPRLLLIWLVDLKDQKKVFSTICFFLCLFWYKPPRNCPAAYHCFSDDLFQAQQQLARWASEDVVSVVVMEQGSDSSHAQGPSSASTMHGHIQQHPSHQQQQLHHDNNNSTTITTTSNVNGVPAMGSCHNITSLSHQLVNSRDYYPSPPSTETESSGSVVQPSRRGPIMQGQGPDGNHIMENTGRYPEYKHW